MGIAPKEFEAWDKIAEEFEYNSGYWNLTRRGDAVLDTQKWMVDQLVSMAYRCYVAGYYEVLAVNTPLLASEIGHRLLEEYPDEPFVAMHSLVPFESGTKHRWSLRSREGFDVSVIAKKMGGGGHAQAAGFII